MAWQMLIWRVLIGTALLIALLAAAGALFFVPQGQPEIRGGILLQVGVEPGEGDAVALLIEASGLTPGGEYEVVLRAGTCQAPSVSAGRLGTMTGDSDGRAALRAESVTATGAGEAIGLTGEMLRDGRTVSLEDGDGTVLCSPLPPQPEPGVATTPMPTTTASPSPSPDSATPSPTSSPTGIPAIDAAIAATEAGDSQALRAQVVLTPTACEPPQQGAGGPPECLASESEGTLVPVFAAASCEGYYLRDDAIGQQVEMFLEGGLALHSVYETTRWLSHFGGDYVAIFTVEEEHPVGTIARQLLISADGITGLNMGCAQTAEEMIELQELTTPLYRAS